MLEKEQGESYSKCSRITSQYFLTLINKKPNLWKTYILGQVQIVVYEYAKQ